MQKSDPCYIYSNIMNVSFSNYDFVIDFGLKAPGESKSNDISPEELQGRIHMSPQHFKAMVLAVGENLHKYEQVFGEINLEPNSDALRRLEAAAGKQ